MDLPKRTSRVCWESIEAHNRTGVVASGHRRMQRTRGVDWAAQYTRESRRQCLADGVEIPGCVEN